MPSKDLDQWILHVGIDGNWIAPDSSPGSPKIARQKEWAPKVDVLEAPQEIIIKVELAGVRAGQVVINFVEENHSLIVRGERTANPTEPCIPMSPHQIEIDYGQFAREIYLPQVSIQLDSAQAQLLNGILTIVIPKAREPKFELPTNQAFITIERLK